MTQAIPKMLKEVPSKVILEDDLYQKRNPRSIEVVNRIKIERCSQIPKIILTIAPCRTGTTASLRVFGAIGIKAYYQPMKAILRWMLQEEDLEMKHTWAIPQASRIYIKETIGPYTSAESLFNPLEILRLAFFESLRREKGDYAGIQEDVEDMLRKKVHIVMLGRDPSDTWYSWKRKFTGKGIPLDRLYSNFVQAHYTVEKIRQDAIKQGFKVSHYLFEANKNTQIAVTGLFKQLGIKKAPILDGWVGLNASGEGNFNIFFPKEPLAFEVPGLHDVNSNSNGFEYCPGGGKGLSAEEKERLVKDGIYEIYNKWKVETEKELGIII